MAARHDALRAERAMMRFVLSAPTMPRWWPTCNGTRRT
jgi:hypothetical protein